VKCQISRSVFLGILDLEQGAAHGGSASL